jgi:hypothetical protein
MYQAKPIPVNAEQFIEDPSKITLVELTRLHESQIYCFYDPHIEETVTVLPEDWIVIKFKGEEHESIEVLSDLDFKRQFEDGPN